MLGNCIEMVNVELLQGNINEVKVYVGDFPWGMRGLNI